MSSIEMVKLDRAGDFFVDELWDRSLEIDKAVTKNIVDSGQLAPAFTSCPICTSTKLELFTIKDGLRIDRCDACGFRFTNPAPTEAQLEIFYNSEAKTIENQIFEATRAVRLPIFERRIDLINRYASGGTLLDVGGAIGLFVDAIEHTRSPFNVSVIDLSEEAMNKLRIAHPNVEVFCDNVFNHHKTYDIVTLWDTIEHLPDVNRVVAHLFSLVKPGGHIFISTPNIDGFEHWVGQERHPQVVPMSHLNYFSMKTLQLLFNRHGFIVLDCLTPNGSFDIAYVDRLVKSGEADMGKLGEFLCEKLQNPELAEDFAKLISKHRLAGNIVVVGHREA